MSRPLWAPLVVRTLAAKLVLPLAVVACWVFLYTPDPLWLGRPSDLGLQVHAFIVSVVGVLLGAATAWEVSMMRGASTAANLTATRSLTSQLAMHTGVGTCWGVLLMLVAWLAGWFRSVGLSTPGQTPWSLLLLTACLCALEIAIGAVIGTVLPSLMAAAVAPALLYLLVYWQTRQAMEVGPRRFYPVVTEHWAPAAAPAGWRILLAGTWCVLLAGVLIHALAHAKGHGGHPSSTLLLLVASLTAAVVLGLLRPTPAGMLLAVPAAQTARTCHLADGYDVCVWSSERTQLETVLDGVTESRRALEGVLPLPSHYAEQGLTTPDPQVTQTFYFIPPPRDPSVVAKELTLGALPRASSQCIKLMNVPALGNYALDLLNEEILSRRLGAPVHTDGPLTDAASRILRLPRDQQDGLLRRINDSLTTCSDAPQLP